MASARTTSPTRTRPVRGGDRVPIIDFKWDGYIMPQRSSGPTTFRRAARRAHARDDRAGALRDARGRRDRNPARHPRGLARRHRRRLWGDDAGAAGYLDAELLAGPAAGDPVLGDPGMAAGLWARDV